MVVASAGTYASLHFTPDRFHASTPPLSFLQAGCPSCRPTNSVKKINRRLSQNDSRQLYAHYLRELRIALSCKAILEQFAVGERILGFRSHDRREAERSVRLERRISAEFDRTIRVAAAVIRRHPPQQSTCNYDTIRDAILTCARKPT